jgi:hypothetical protein
MARKRGRMLEGSVGSAGEMEPSAPLPCTEEAPEGVVGLAGREEKPRGSVLGVLEEEQQDGDLAQEDCGLRATVC